MDAHGEFLVTICTVVGSVAAALIWMTYQFHKMNEKINRMEKSFDKRFNRIEKELVAIKTIMFANGTPVPNTAVNEED